MRDIDLGVIQISDWEPTDKLYPAYYEDDPDSWFKEELETYSKLKPDQVILKPNKEFILEISYPLSVPCKVKIKTGKKGVSRKKLVHKIVTTYRKIYDIEDDTSKNKAGYISGMLNRNSTNGKFGIWGHCIQDLILCSAHISRNNVITVGVDS